MSAARRLAGWLVLGLVAWAVFAVLQHFHGPSDKWGLPKVDECGQRLVRAEGEDDLVVIDCDDPSAQYRVIRRVDGTTDSSECNGVSGATDVFIFDGNNGARSEEAVFCLAAIAH